MTTPSLVPPLLFGVPLREVLTGQWNADLGAGLRVHVYLNKPLAELGGALHVHSAARPFFEMYAHHDEWRGACVAWASGADFDACAAKLRECFVRRTAGLTAAAAAMERAA